ncbi:MAG TPA: DUF1800 domain-containing protein [Chitinophagales bacterium]|nr:DUF1800 domain-containing protein [Chitinophagales bacterium]
MITEKDKIKHLHNRAAFGVTMNDWQTKTNLKNCITDLLKTPVKYTYLYTITKDEVDAAKEKIKNLSKEDKKDLKQLLKENVRELNNLWLNEMIHSPAQLNEKMAFFWHGHFACRSANPYFDQQYLDIIRKHALGNFSTMLNEIAKTPAMLQYLNNQQNKKDHPNENFAREVMELFTLGRGNYTEQDVKEAARAFTGFAFDKTGEFKFRKQLHDFDQKIFQGKTGNFSGEDILQIILAKKECAYFITKKIFKFFVNDIIDEEKVTQLADKFYQSNYDIKSLMTTIFSSDWFYDEKNIGAKIKSPIELLAGMFRVIPTAFKDNESTLFIQRALGQILLNPPNVAGWNGGRSWIDSSSLLFRMQLPQVIYFDKEVSVEPKEITPESKQEMQLMMTESYIKKLASKKLNAQADWTTIINYFSKIDTVENEMSSLLLSKKIDASTIKIIKANTDNTSKEATIKKTFINILSLPEYQLC